MSMEVKLFSMDRVLKVYLSGQCIFSNYADFQGVMQQMNGYEYEQVQLDISELAYIDSSGLGMLLLMREKCQQKQCLLIIQQPRGQVQKMFDIAQLNDVFNVQR